MWKINKIEFVEMMTELFQYKCIVDEHGNEYVLFNNSKYESVCNIKDHTEFESFENHVHLVDRLNRKEFIRCIPVAKSLGKAVLACLKKWYPEKNFIVYVSMRLGDSMIIRFHQQWAGELPYCNPSEFSSDTEKVYAFEG